MLAALLLNLGGQQPPPPVARPRFGGGPFTSRYGYDPRYYRQTTTSALPATEVPILASEGSVPSREPSRTRSAAPINYRAINQSVSEAVARDMREFSRSEIARRVAEQEDEEIEVIMLMMLN